MTQNTRKGWGYYVSPQAWADQIRQCEAIIAQLDACTAAQVEPVSAEGDEPWRLACWDHAIAQRMGVDGADLAALCLYVELWFPWHDDLPEAGADWYKRGKAIVVDLENRFGSNIVATMHRANLRQQAKRRLATARRKLAG